MPRIYRYEEFADLDLPLEDIEELMLVCMMSEEEIRLRGGVVAALIFPTNAYITEDASQFYITEDGNSVYVTERAQIPYITEDASQNYITEDGNSVYVTEQSG